jgi:ketosteroid isomerase-like protein
MVCIGSGMAPVDVMRRYLAAVQRGDWATGFGFFTDDVTLHVPGRSSLAGEHRGREAVEGYRFPSPVRRPSGRW